MLLACTGTENGLSTSGSTEQILERAKWIYTNCTLVEGNLELVRIEKNVTFTKVNSAFVTNFVKWVLFCTLNE